MAGEKAKEDVQNHGGRVSGSVSAKTDYLIVGVEPGSKLKEAEKLGVKTISEQEFLKLIK